MFDIFAGYAPDSQRSDKFKIPEQMTKDEIKARTEKSPFLNLYLAKYGNKQNLSLLVWRSVFLALTKGSEDHNYLAGLTPARPTKQKVGPVASRELRDSVRIRKNADNSFTLQLKIRPLELNVMEIAGALGSVFNLAGKKGEEDSSPSLPLIKEAVERGLASHGASLNSMFEFEVPLADMMTGTVKHDLALQSITRVNIYGNGDETINCEIDCHISASDAQVLTQEPAIAVRNIDLYPIFTSWAESGYLRANTVSIALSRIATNLSPNHTMYAKTNDYGLVLTEKGNLAYLPKSCDNTRIFEDKYNEACTNKDNPDGFYGSFNTSSDKLRSLTKNMPILMDWTNCRFSYTNGEGKLTVLDISQWRKAEPAHIVNVFRRKLIDKQDIIRYCSLAQYCLENLDVPNADDVANAVVESANGRRERVDYYTLCSNPTDSPIIEGFLNYLCELAESLKNNNLRYMTNFSYSAYTQDMGMLIAISGYYGKDGVKWLGTTEEANSEYSAAINQRNPEDPQYNKELQNWQAPSIPLLNPKIKAMPHQKKVINMLKDNPRYALLPVAAGGGKTPLAIWEILYHYKDGKNEPYLVLCPSPLVSQYAQEVSFFTNARLNTIPITTSVIKREGFDRLQKIFEAAPRNTVVVASYDALRYGKTTINYGTEETTLFPTVEFMRQFGFQLAICDESHLLKNTDTSRSKAVRSLLADIPYIRLASGTMAYNMVSDLVGQAAILDPSIFGNETEFKEAYYDKSSDGKKFTTLSHGSEIIVRKRLKECMVIAEAKRKEWAALLPTPITKYHPVNLTLSEQDEYRKLINDTLDEISANDSGKLVSLMKKLDTMKEEDGDPEEIQDLANKVASRLSVYLQNIERFLTDPAGAFALGIGDSNNVPAKISKVLEILRSHISMFKSVTSGDGVKDAKQKLAVQNTNKAIIFVQYTDSAKAIFNAAESDPALKGTGLLYSASNKAELINRFNTDPNVRWMVGVEASINTGLNLQSASRIIRAEYPWTPGAIEQGEARILRPNKKGPETRKNVYFDWIMVDGTTDTLKIARLMAKSAQIAKYENAGDERYEDIGMSDDYSENGERLPLQVLSLSMNNIKAEMKFVIGDSVNGDDSENQNKVAGVLYPYFQTMKDLAKIRREDFANYRLNHPELLNPDGTMKESPFVIEKNPKDAKLLKYVPFVEGTNLFKSDELGLERVDQFLARSAKNEEEYLRQFQQDAEEDDSNEEKSVNNEAMRTAIAKLEGQIGYCEYGECKIERISLNQNVVSIRPIGTTQRIKVTKDSCFIITSKEIKPAMLQQKILEAVGFKEYSVPVEAPDPKSMTQIQRRRVTEEDRKKDEEQRIEQERLKNEADLRINIDCIKHNGVLGLQFLEEAGHEFAINVLQQNGFTHSAKYSRARIKNYKMFEDLMRIVSKKGLRFKAPYDYAGAWKMIGDTLKKLSSANPDPDAELRVTNARMCRIISDANITNMLRLEQKVTKDPELLRIYPLFSAGRVFAVMPDFAFYSAAKGIKKSTGKFNIKWEFAKPSYDHYFDKPAEAIAMLKHLKEVGLNIINFEETLRILEGQKCVKYPALKDMQEKAKKERKVKVKDKHVNDDAIDSLEDRKQRKPIDVKHNPLDEETEEERVKKAEKTRMKHKISNLRNRFGI